MRGIFLALSDSVVFTVCAKEEAIVHKLNKIIAPTDMSKLSRLAVLMNPANPGHRQILKRV